MMRNDLKALLDELEKRCAAVGSPVTGQRRVVFEVLVGRDDHPTVDQLYQAVAERMPDVSRATVYRSIEKLDELGLLRRVEHPGSAVRLDGNTRPHYHFLCTRCGAIEDLPLEAVQGHEGLAFVGADHKVVEDISVTVRGRCARCHPT